MTAPLQVHMPVPVIASNQLLVFLLQIGLLLGLALLFGVVAARVGLPPLIGELAAGILIGPSVLGHAAPGLSAWIVPADPNQMHLLDAVGQFAVIMLVLVAGTHLDLGLIRRQRKAVLSVGLVGLLIPLGLGVALGFGVSGALMGEGAHRGVFALLLGVAMCVSAIPVIAKTLLDLGLLHRNIGQLILSSAVISDCFGWLLLSVASALAGTDTGHVWVSLACLAALPPFIYFVGRPLVRWILSQASRPDQPGIVITTTVVLTVLFAAATQALGFEAIIGAFLCGTLIGSTPGLDLAKLAPLHTFTMAVLAPIFFATVGLRMDVGALTQWTVLEAGLLILLVATVGKFAGAYLGARVSRLTHWEGFALGAGLNSRGVIEVVVALVGLRLGVWNTDIYTILVLVAVITSMMAPPLLRVAARRIDQLPEEVIRAKSVQDLEHDSSLRPTEAQA